jgi:hypothetical protein
VSLLEDSLRKVFGLAQEQHQVVGGLLPVVGAVALGAMLDHPQKQLGAMRPHLATWLRPALSPRVAPPVPHSFVTVRRHHTPRHQMN